MRDRPSPADAEFGEFFLARGPALRRTAYLIVRDWHVAEDVTQVALTRVHSAWRRIRPESLDAYARRAVVNAALSTLRRRRREWPAADVPETRAPETAESALDVDRALGLLAPQQRAIVALRFLDDLPVADVAAALGIAEGTVKSQTSRALATLRAHLPELVLTEEPS
jgi:RNA polymerase sigma-70 factor (sigma-E family)